MPAPLVAIPLAVAIEAALVDLLAALAVGTVVGTGIYIAEGDDGDDAYYPGELEWYDGWETIQGLLDELEKLYEELKKLLGNVKDLQAPGDNPDRQSCHEVDGEGREIARTKTQIEKNNTRN